MCLCTLDACAYQLRVLRLCLQTPCFEAVPAATLNVYLHHTFFPPPSCLCLCVSESQCEYMRVFVRVSCVCVCMCVWKQHLVDEAGDSSVTLETIDTAKLSAGAIVQVLWVSPLLLVCINLCVRALVLCPDKV